MTWKQAVDRGPDTVLAVPVGSTEQHGPHLPLSTDTDIAVRLAGLLGDRRPRVLIAPAVSYGASGEHADFAGTLSIGHEALELLLVELVRSASEWCSRVLLVSAHGGNRDAVLRVERRMRAESHAVRTFIPRWDGDAHAGHLETSLMLAIDPARVDLRRAEAGALQPIQQLMPRLTAEGVRKVSPNGVLGDPSGASASEGHALLELAAAQMCDLLARWDSES
jgi:creatinine amidohydrolase